MMTPRKRQINHAFFMNEDLSKLSAQARLFYIGTWTLADREGRLENRPKLLEAYLFPHENIQVQPLLDELIKAKFIVPYDDNKHLFIPKFNTHQKIHPNEAQSALPPPPPSLQRKRKPQIPPEMTPGELADLFNNTCVSLQKVRSIDSGTNRHRAAQLRIEAAQIKAPGKVLKVWTQLFTKVQKSDFLAGRAKRGDTHANWNCTFDWILKPGNSLKIYEGTYDNDKQTGLTKQAEVKHFAKKESQRSSRKSSGDFESGDFTGMVDKIKRKAKKKGQ